MTEYKWRFCRTCNLRIFRGEEEGDTIKTINETLYCIDCAREKVVEGLEKLEIDIRFALKYYEPEDLPHKPIRMTVTEEDVVALKNALEFLKEEDD